LLSRRTWTLPEWAGEFKVEQGGIGATAQGRLLLERLTGWLIVFWMYRRRIFLRI